MRALFCFSVMYLMGCGGLAVDGESSPLTAPACADVSPVGAAQNCVSSPGHNGPSPTVTCQSNHDGVIVPIVGCTIDLLAAPGVPYTALCVQSCEDAEL